MKAPRGNTFTFGTNTPHSSVSIHQYTCEERGTMPCPTTQENFPSKPNVPTLLNLKHKAIVTWPSYLHVHCNLWKLMNHRLVDHV